MQVLFNFDCKKFTQKSPQEFQAKFLKRHSTTYYSGLILSVLLKICRLNILILL